MGGELKILQVFNRYIEYGGEEGSVERIAEQLGKVCHLETYTESTEALLSMPGGKYRMPFLMQSNAKVLNDLKALQMEEEFDIWQIHNVFPGLSVAVYELAVELEVPVIQFLHNYRFGCADATYFRNGKKCFECSPGNFLPALRHRCWRGSFLATGSMVLALKRFWRKGGLGGIKAFIAISESQKKRHVEMGVPEDLINVIPHSLEVKGHQAKPPLGGDVMFFGRLTEEKGLRLLLEAWSIVDTKGRLLRIVGKGEIREELEELVRVKKITNVKFEGFVPKEKHSTLWEKCAFTVAPSIWEEPFGMVVLEAWKNSRPILTTNIGSFPELINDGENGWLGADDLEGFSKVLQRAIEDSGSYEQMGRNGNEKLRREFNKDVWLGKWEKVAKTVTSSNL
jgi:glycosyltransferase involved in cell wall biosynthesis